jgi:predicted nucleotidyltransferase component of viral defense system
MSVINLQDWVLAETDPARKTFRQAVHLVLRAIANSHRLAPLMVMKGGSLLAIRYNSPRFTKDIDFSTTQVFSDAEAAIFLEDLDDALLLADADNEYGLSLRIQSTEVKPRAEKSPKFPTLQVKVGYALRSMPNQLKQLNAKNAAHTVSIDYSYNEWSTGIEQQSIDGGQLSMYGFHDLIAEKYRSILQQPLRNRKRYQDVYDLCLLLDEANFNAADKANILAKLQAACTRVGITPTKASLKNEKVIALSQADYQKELPTLLKEAPPEFSTAYKQIQDFYESLPW